MSKKRKTSTRPRRYSGSKTARPLRPLRHTNASFIKKARKIHGDLYNYDKVDYINNYTKIIIICSVHGEFEQTPNAHIKSKVACRQCSIDNSRQTLEEFVEKANIAHENKYDYSQSKYINTNTNIVITCKLHGEFLIRPVDHVLHGKGCPECGKIAASNKRKTTLAEFIERANLVHETFYDYSLVDYINMHVNVQIICPTHGIFSKTPCSHLSGAGCRRCRRNMSKNVERVPKLERIVDTKTFIKRARQIHGSKYIYSESKYTKYHAHVKIICPVIDNKNEKTHGIFRQTVADHLSGSGCPLCKPNKIRAKLSKPQDTFISQAEQIHGTKYDYSQTKYVNAHTKLDIICSVHGLFKQLPTVHLRGSICPQCDMENKSLTTEQFIKNAKKVHGNLYDYSAVKYVNAVVEVPIYCHKHGIFLQNPAAHVKGSGCTQCSHQSYSKVSIKWLNYIANRDNIEIEHAEHVGEFRIPGSKYRADGYCRETNTIYEFDGCYFHGCPCCYDPNDTNTICKLTFGELQEKTIIKAKYITSKGFKLVKICEHDFAYFMDDNDDIDVLVENNNHVDKMRYICDNIYRFIESPFVKKVLAAIGINPNILTNDLNKGYEFEFIKLSNSVLKNPNIIDDLFLFFRNFYLDESVKLVVV